MLAPQTRPDHCILFFLQSKTYCTSAQSNIPVAAQSRPQFFFVDEIYEIKDGGSQVCWKPKVVGDAAAALRPLQGRLGRRLPHGTDQPGYHHHHQQQQKHHHHHQQQPILFSHKERINIK